MKNAAIQFNGSNFEGINGDDLTNLKGHIKQVGDDVVVSLLDGDQFILRDSEKADLDADNFLF